MSPAPTPEMFVTFFHADAHEVPLPEDDMLESTYQHLPLWAGHEPVTMALKLAETVVLAPIVNAHVLAEPEQTDGVEEKVAL